MDFFRGEAPAIFRCVFEKRVRIYVQPIYTFDVMFVVVIRGQAAILDLLCAHRLFYIACNVSISAASYGRVLSHRDITSFLLESRVIPSCSFTFALYSQSIVFNTIISMRLHEIRRIPD